MDNDWTELHQNIGKAHAIWRRLGKLLRRKGENTQLSVLLYREVIQAVLLFGLESWDLEDMMIRNVESTHVGFLYQITGKQTIRQCDGS